MTGISPILKGGFTAPQPQLPAKIIFGGTNNDFSDPLEIAKEGIRDTLVIMPDRFNVRQVLDDQDVAGASYTGLDRRYIENMGFKGFIFHADIVSKERMLFDGVSEYVLMGGHMNGNLRRGFFSILAIQSLHAQVDVVRLFTEDGCHHMAGREINAIRRLELEQLPSVTFHFPMTAVYPKLSGLIYRNEKIANAREQTFGSWEQIRDSLPNHAADIREYVTFNMPFEYWSMLNESGLNIFGFIDGVPMKSPLSTGKDGPFHANIFFWSSTSALARHLTGNDSH